MSTNPLTSGRSATAGGSDGGALLTKANAVTTKSSVSGLEGRSGNVPGGAGVGSGIGLGMKNKNAVHGVGIEDLSWLLALKPPSTKVIHPITHPIKTPLNTHCFIPINILTNTPIVTLSSFPTPPQTTPTHPHNHPF